MFISKLFIRYLVFNKNYSIKKHFLLNFFFVKPKNLIKYWLTDRISMYNFTCYLRRKPYTFPLLQALLSAQLAWKILYITRVKKKRWKVARYRRFYWSMASFRINKYHIKTELVNGFVFIASYVNDNLSLSFHWNVLPPNQQNCLSTGFYFILFRLFFYKTRQDRNSFFLVSWSLII